MRHSIQLHKALVIPDRGGSYVSARQPPLLVLIGVCLLASSTGAAQQDAPQDATEYPEWAFRVLSENDTYPGSSDEYYTQGLRLSLYLPSSPLWGSMARSFGENGSAPDCAAMQPGDRKCLSTEFALGQNFYTPEDITIPTLIPDDRPYAGWLYLGMTARIEGASVLDEFEVAFGVTGPPSLGETIQTWWHGLPFISAPIPQGWDHQIKTELGIILGYQRKIALDYERDGLRLVEIVPSFGFRLGNIFTYGNAGLTLRVGYNLTRDWSAGKISPTIRITETQRRQGRGFEIYALVGVEGRAVLRNIFLDGNTFRDSHRVDKESLVGDYEYGLGFRVRWFRFGYRVVTRSVEFEGGRPHHFGSISVVFAKGF